MSEYKRGIAHASKQNGRDHEGHTPQAPTQHHSERLSNMKSAARSFFSKPVQMNEKKDKQKDEPDAWDDSRTIATSGNKAAAIKSLDPSRLKPPPLDYDRVFRGYMMGEFNEATLKKAEAYQHMRYKKPSGLSNRYTHNMKVNHDQIVRGYMTGEYSEATLRRSEHFRHVTNSTSTSKSNNIIDFVDNNQGIRGGWNKFSNATNKLAGPLGILGGASNTYSGVEKLNSQNDAEKLDGALQTTEGAAGCLSGAIGTMSAIFPSSPLFATGATALTSGALATTGTVAGGLATGLMLGRRGDNFAREHLGDYPGQDNAGKSRGWSDYAADLGTSSYEEAIKEGHGEVYATMKGAGMTAVGSIGGAVGAMATGTAGIFEDVGEAFTSNANEYIEKNGSNTKIQEAPANASASVV